MFAGVTTGPRMKPEPPKCAAIAVNMLPARPT
jgi:hypothetical protein